MVNCRKVCGLMSAYIDSELPVPQMEEIRAHLQKCAPCRLEQEALTCTKKLVASLSTRAPESDLERLLTIEAHRAENKTQADRVRDVWEEAGYALRSPLLSKPLTITAALSLAGLWLATTTLDRPRDWNEKGGMPNAALLETPQTTVIVFQQAPPLPPAYRGVPMLSVALPISSPTEPGQWGAMRASLPHPSRGVFIRAAYPAPVPFEWSDARPQDTPPTSDGAGWQPALSAPQTPLFNKAASASH